MQKERENRMKKYIKESLGKGYSLEQIEKALVNHNYPEKLAKAITSEYRGRQERKAWLISNNMLMGVVVLLMIVTVISNYYLIYGITGMASKTSTMSGTMTLCVNRQPSLNITTCNNETNISVQYLCNITATDPDSNAVFMYYDNTSIFEINNTNGALSSINYLGVHIP